VETALIHLRSKGVHPHHFLTKRASFHHGHAIARRPPTHLLTFDHCVSIPRKSGRALISSGKKSVRWSSSEVGRPSQQGSPRSRHLPQSKRPLSLSAAYCVWVLITHVHTYVRSPNSGVRNNTAQIVWCVYTQ